MYVYWYSQNISVYVVVFKHADTNLFRKYSAWFLLIPGVSHPQRKPSVVGRTLRLDIIHKICIFELQWTIHDIGDKGNLGLIDHDFAD